MGDINKMKNPFGVLPERLKEYIGLKADLYGLYVSKKMYRGLSALVLFSVIGFLALFFLVFLSYALFRWFVLLVGDDVVAGLIMSGIFVLLMLIVYSFRKKWIYNPIRNFIFGSLDFDEINEKSVIEPITKDEDIEKQLENVRSKIEQVNSELEQTVNQIEYYYSFEAVKERFVNQLLRNPKPLIANALTAFMTMRSYFRKRRTRRK